MTIWWNVTVGGKLEVEVTNLMVETMVKLIAEIATLIETIRGLIAAMVAAY